MKGTSTEQDSRWSNKQKKLEKEIRFPSCFSKKIALSKVNISVIKPWIARQLLSLLQFEDEVVLEYIFQYLDAEVFFI